MCAAIVNCAAVDAAGVRVGEVSAACGKAAYAYIEQAIAAAQAGNVAAVVTAPINKEALNLGGVKYPGHTEIFTELTGSTRSCMMLTSEAITVSFVTGHVSYADVPAALTVERVRDVIELTADAMARIRRRSPRLLVCGLNPHAGEHGLFGTQEQDVLAPAIAEAEKAGLDVVGPISPDAAFLHNRLRDVDAFICMYHDQGHIPFKMLAFDSGVNVTLGLPIVRTSVDHGTAFDIAWKGRASAASLVQAIGMALKLAGTGNAGGAGR